MSAAGAQAPVRAAAMRLIDLNASRATGVARVAPQRLSAVQALRGLAAAAVVLSHAARHIDKAFGAPVLITLFQAGHAGVDLFFVISGFIILFVHRGDIGRPARLGHYASRRFTRVLPLYWVALAMTIAMSAAGGGAMPSPVSFIWASSLLPTLGEPLLGISWTLQFEMLFYTVFAVLILNRRVGVALFAVWFGWIAISAIGLGIVSLPGPFRASYGLEFLMGMVAARTLAAWRTPAPLFLTAAGATLFIAMLTLESVGVINGFGVIARFAYGIPAMLLVVGVASAERDGVLSVPGWLQAIGGASYSIYLFQFVFIGFVWKAWQWAGLARPSTDLLCFLLLASTAIAGGLVMSRLVEQNLLRLMRRNPPNTART